jgi:hypothetical protein
MVKTIYTTPRDATLPPAFWHVKMLQRCTTGANYRHQQAKDLPWTDRIR